MSKLSEGHINLRVPRDTKRDLEDRADRLGISVSNIVRDLVESYLVNDLVDDSVSLTQLEQARKQEVQRHDAEVRKLDAQIQAIRDKMRRRAEQRADRRKIEELAIDNEVQEWVLHRTGKWTEFNPASLLNHFQSEFNQEMTYPELQKLIELVEGE